MSTVGIVSPGAMGSALGAAFRDGGARVVGTVEGRSARTADLAQGLELLPALDDVVAASDILVSVVPPGAAASVAEAVAAAAKRSGGLPLVADLNAIAPATATAVAGRLAAAGLELVDGSISGPPPRYAGTTIVYLSGPRAGELAALEAPRLTFRVVGASIGTASAVKMSTASFYKGQTALFVQAVRAASANGVLDVVLDDLRRHYPDLVEDAPRLLQSIAAKSGRYVGEMEEISVSQEEVGLTPELFRVVAAVYLELSRTELAERSPEEVDPAARLDDLIAGLGRSAGRG